MTLLRKRPSASRFALALSVLATGAMASSPGAPAGATDGDTCAWANTGNGSWHTAANWDCDGVARLPTIDDDVVIDIAPSGASLTVTMSSDAEAASVRVGEMAATHTEAHRLTMSGGVAASPRQLTIGTGEVVVHRSGLLTTGRPTNPTIGHVGWIGRISGPAGAPVGVLVHGKLNGLNMELTGHLAIDRPPTLIDGPGGGVHVRGATSVSGDIDVEEGEIFVAVHRGEAPDTPSQRPPRL